MGFGIVSRNYNRHSNPFAETKRMIRTDGGFVDQFRVAGQFFKPALMSRSDGGIHQLATDRYISQVQVHIPALNVSNQWSSQTIHAFTDAQLNEAAERTSWSSVNDDR